MIRGKIRGKIRGMIRGKIRGTIRGKTGSIHTLLVGRTTRGSMADVNAAAAAAAAATNANAAADCESGGCETAQDVREATPIET